jgi:hypothetical protein
LQKKIDSSRIGKEKMPAYEKRMVVFSGEARIAMILEEKLCLFPLRARRFREDEKVELTSEFVQLPIDPTDLEFFGRNLVLYQNLYLAGRSFTGEKIFGYVHDGKFYLKPLMIQEDPHKWAFYRIAGRIVRGRGDSVPNIFASLLEELELHSCCEIFPLKFFIYQRLRLSFNQGIFDPNILQHVCPISTQSEVAAICTKQGCVGVITKKNLMFLGQSHITKIEYGGITDNAYFGAYDHLLLEKKIPLNTCFPDLPPSFEQSSHAICSFEYGASGGFVINRETQSVYFPEFFLRRANIMHDGDRVFTVKIKHATWTLTLPRNSDGFLEEYLGRYDLRYEETTNFNYNLASYPGNWGLFGRNMVLFPGAARMRIFVYDPTQDDWFTMRQGEREGVKEIVYICLDSKERIIDAVMDRQQFVPADIGKLIVSFTYDHFLEETRDEQYQDLDQNFIKVSRRANDAKKLLLERG